MSPVEKIKEILNGGGKIAGVKDVRKAIGELVSDGKAYRRELEEIPAKRADAAWADEPTKAIAALRAREEELYDLLEVGEVRLVRLRERLNELTGTTRKAELIERRKAIAAAADLLVDALQKASESFQNFIAARERAGAAGFHADLQHAPVAPFLFNLVDRQMLVEFERGLAVFRTRLLDPPADTSARRGVPSGRAFEFDGAESARAILAERGLVPPAPAIKSPANPAVAAPPVRSMPASSRVKCLDPVTFSASGDAPSIPRKPPRALFNDAAGEGERRVTIFREGYEAPDGRQCRVGDVIALPLASAELVVKHGAGDFAESGQ